MKMHLARGFHRREAIFIGGGIRGGQPRHQELDVRPGLLDRSAWCQPSTDEEPPIAPAIEPGRAGRRRDDIVKAERFDFERGRNRDPDLGREHRHHPPEGRRRNADDRVRVAADSQRPTDRSRRARKVAAPVPIRDHRHARRARHIVFGQDRAAAVRPDAKHAEVVAGDGFTHRQPRPVAEIQRCEHRRVTGHVFEHVVLRLQIEIVEIRGGAEALGAA